MRKKKRKMRISYEISEELIQVHRSDFVKPAPPSGPFQWFLLPKRLVRFRGLAPAARWILSTAPAPWVTRKGDTLSS